MDAMVNPKIVAHHVGARGYGVSFAVVPPHFRDDVAHVLYEADAECVEQMLKDTKSKDAEVLHEMHVFPYCLGRGAGRGMLHIAANAYASSLLPPEPKFHRNYCEILIDGAVYDVTYGDMLEIVRRVELEVHAIDELFRNGAIDRALAPDFLSIDTQGAELEILCGAREMLGGVLGIVCEVEMQAMYAGQPLFGDILSHLAGQGFLFAGYVDVYEVSAHRAPVGLRGNGFPGFGDALFLRDLDTAASGNASPDQAYARYLKAALIGLTFGFVEYALDAMARAEQHGATASNAFKLQMDERRYVRFLRELAEAAAQQARVYPPVHAIPNSSRQAGDVRTSWYDKHHREALLRFAASRPSPAPESIFEQRHRDAIARFLPDRLPPGSASQPLGVSGLLRLTLARVFRRTLPARVARPLCRAILRSAPTPPATPAAAQPGAIVIDPATGKLQGCTPFEHLLGTTGFERLMQVVRDRRLRAEEYLRVLTPEMLRDGAYASLPRD